MAAGAYVTASLAQTFGSPDDRRAAAGGYYVAAAALVPCPPLLIADLGRPDRFHHMLRIFKPHSPMNMGAWALTAFSGPATLLALAEFAALRWFPARVIGVAGLPFAFFMLAYPCVLLAT